MRVAVMHVGEMRVGVQHWRMPVRMTMRFLAIPVKRMIVLVMDVMDVFVIVRHRLVEVFMLVVFGEV
jgi:hypothetical protein